MAFLSVVPTLFQGELVNKLLISMSFFPRTPCALVVTIAVALKFALLVPVRLPSV